MNIFARFAQDESGATAIEYGLIAALVAVGIIAAVSLMGDNLSAVFNRISTSLNAEGIGTAPTASTPPATP